MVSARVSQVRCMPKLSDRLRKYVKVAQGATRGVRVLKQTGLLGALHARGILAFARSGTAKGKPGWHKMVRLHAFNTPDKTAIVYGDRRFTYAEVDERVMRLTHALHGLGIEPGTQAAVMLGNCNEYLELQMALLHLRGTTVQVS